jgi:hypothetical protein
MSIEKHVFTFVAQLPEMLVSGKVVMGCKQHLFPPTVKMIYDRGGERQDSQVTPTPSRKEAVLPDWANFRPMSGCLI